MIVTSLCRASDFSKPWYIKWMREIKEPPRLHRKQWEFGVIMQALAERGMLAPGKRGLGFGVGTEPLPALFIKYGCNVLVTDLDPHEQAAKKWRTGNQLLEKVSSLNDRKIVDPNIFKKNISYRAVDMNAIPNDLRNFDFTWSACSMDHLGTLEKTKQFIINQMDCLKDGGWGIHTSEFNVSSNTETVTEGDIVVFRKADIIDVAERLEKLGYSMEVLDFRLGRSKADRYVDEYPYTHVPHLKLSYFGYVGTSFIMIVHKGKIDRKLGFFERLRNRWYRSQGDPA